MATTLGRLWIDRNPPKRIQWWTPSKNSNDGYDVVYGEGERLDWSLTENDIGRGHGTAVDQVELKDVEGTTFVVAMKKFQKNGDRNSRRMIEEIKAEVNLIRRLSHIHVVEAVGSVTYPRFIGFFMRPRAEFNLSDLLSGLPDNQERRKVLEKNVWHKMLPAFLISTLGCLAHGLMYIHSQNIRHKDIKPNNILIDGARVVFVDFGLSRIYEENFTTSSGPTGKTRIYAPMEAILGTDRSRSQDIFSLGICFAEIFACYKGKAADDIRVCFGENAEKNGTNAFAYHVPAVLAWIKKNLVAERCDIQLWNLIRHMLATDRKMRPTAKIVWEETVILSSQTEPIHFCGACCMPVIPETISEPKSLPVPHDYVYGPSSTDLVSGRLANANASFDTVYHRDEKAPYCWQRNLRMTNQAGLDAVDFRENPFLARKIIWPKDDTPTEVQKAADAAIAEANILQRLHNRAKHNHIVKLHGTYQQCQNYVLLIDPLADFDLKTYLAFVEQPHAGEGQLKNTGNVKSILQMSFGCLASALRHIHAENIVHGDLSSTNILVSPQASQKIHIAEFGKAAFKESQMNILSTYHGADEDEVAYMDNSAYTAPEAPRPQPPAPSLDIFSLGCVFIEIETVRKHHNLQEMRDFLVQSSTNGEAVKIRYWDEKVIHRLPLWIEKLERESQTLSQLADIMRRMVSIQPSSRPSASEVLREVRLCKEGDDFLCGKYCLHDEMTIH